jgi:hypothetical protein
MLLLYELIGVFRAMIMRIFITEGTTKIKNKYSTNAHITKRIIEKNNHGTFGIITSYK